MIMHFKSQKERLDYLKGGFKEIEPQEVIPQEVKENADITAQKPSEAISEEEKPKKKAGKKRKKDDKVQAE